MKLGQVHMYKLYFTNITKNLCSYKVISAPSSELRLTEPFRTRFSLDKVALDITFTRTFQTREAAPCALPPLCTQALLRVQPSRQKLQQIKGV